MADILRPGASAAPKVAAAQMAARHRAQAAERRAAIMIARIAAGHTRLDADRPTLVQVHETLQELWAARRAVDEIHFAALGAADIWEAERRTGGPTPLDEDDLADAIIKRLELNCAAAIEASEPIGQPTFHDDVRATYRAAAGY
ncbi:hypothetical protein [Methylobacterium currus]|nr:hypothetical protein [Methylobacterium currus]